MHKNGVVCEKLRDLKDFGGGWSNLATTRNAIEPILATHVRMKTSMDVKVRK